MPEPTLQEALDDMKAAYRMSAESCDRFRDVITEAVGLDENPGDDELVRLLRAQHGKTGPEPRQWRDFITGAKARLESSGRRWVSDVAEEGRIDDHPRPAANDAGVHRVRPQPRPLSQRQGCV